MVICSLCPGIVKTGTTHSPPICVRAGISVILAMRARSPEPEGLIIVHALAAVRERHGKYLRNKEVFGQIC